MISRLIKTVSLLLLTTLAVGCKLNVIVPPGGKVESSFFQASDCAGGNVCEIEITDPAYFDSFNPIPDPGYEFVRWQKGIAFLCSDSVGICEVSLPGGELGAAAIALFETVYIMPVWKNVGIDTDLDGIRNELDDDDDNDGVLDSNDNCPLEGPNLDGFGCPITTPITDTVFTPFGEYAQPDLFRGATLEEVRTACPSPSGDCSGAIGGYGVDGWQLVTAIDVQNVGLTVLGGLPAIIDQGCDPGNPVCVAYAVEDMVFLYQVVYGFRSWTNNFGQEEISGYVNESTGAYAGLLQVPIGGTLIQTGVGDDCSPYLLVGAQCGGAPTGVFLRRLPN